MLRHILASGGSALELVPYPAGSISVSYNDSDHDARFHSFILNFNNSGQFGTIEAGLIQMKDIIKNWIIG